MYPYHFSYAWWTHLFESRMFHRTPSYLFVRNKWPHRHLAGQSMQKKLWRTHGNNLLLSFGLQLSDNKFSFLEVNGEPSSSRFDIQIPWRNLLLKMSLSLPEFDLLLLEMRTNNFNFLSKPCGVERWTIAHLVSSLCKIFQTARVNLDQMSPNLGFEKGKTTDTQCNL